MDEKNTQSWTRLFTDSGEIIQMFSEFNSAFLHTKIGGICKKSLLYNKQSETGKEQEKHKQYTNT